MRTVRLFYNKNVRTFKQIHRYLIAVKRVIQYLHALM
jgi:hypothetical protein